MAQAIEFVSRAMRESIRGFARWLAAAVTAVIMISLLLPDPNKAVSRPEWWLIALSPLTQPMLMAAMIIADALSYWLLISIPAWWFTRRAVRAIRTTPEALEPVAVSKRLPNEEDAVSLPPGYRLDDDVVIGPGDEIVALLVADEDMGDIASLPVAEAIMESGTIQFASGTSKRSAFVEVARRHYATKAR